MRYCRFDYRNRQAWGVLDNGSVREIADPYTSPEPMSEAVPVDAVRLLCPINPSKLIAVGLNYKDHIHEFGRTDVPEEPVIFFKAPSAVIGPDQAIVLPTGAGRIDYEGELGVVIGKRARHVTEKSALGYVLGYVCLNDVTARQLQKKDSQWARCKSFDTFAPAGPWIVGDLDPRALKIETRLNGATVQQSSTDQMLFSVAKLISFISGVMTLFPGDVISTGTPVGVGALKPGDIIEIYIEGIGRLRNTVVAESERVRGSGVA